MSVYIKQSEIEREMGTGFDFNQLGYRDQRLIASVILRKRHTPQDNIIATGLEMNNPNYDTIVVVKGA